MASLLLVHFSEWPSVNVTLTLPIVLPSASTFESTILALFGKTVAAVNNNVKAMDASVIAG